MVDAPRRNRTYNLVIKSHSQEGDFVVDSTTAAASHRQDAEDGRRSPSLPGTHHPQSSTTRSKGQYLSNGRGSYLVHRTFRGIGTIRRASGTRNPETLRSIHRALDRLHKSGDAETIRLIIDGRMTLLELIRGMSFSRYQGHRAVGPLNLYVIQAESLNAVKVGVSYNVAQRMADLQAANPVRLTLVWCDVGSKAREQSLHERFAAYRIRGEWFRYEGEVREWDESVTDIPCENTWSGRSGVPRPLPNGRRP